MSTIYVVSQFFSIFDQSFFAVDYPPVDELVAQCAKMKLMDRLLIQLRDRGHKVDSALCKDLSIALAA